MSKTIKPNTLPKNLASWSILKKAPDSAKTAMFYGFNPVEGPHLNKSESDPRVALLREVAESKGIPLPQPFMLWSRNRDTKFSAHKIDCTLSVLGSSKSITEAILIQATRAILEQGGFKNTVVKVNAVGNKESVVEFERKMAAFTRKHFNEFSPELRQALKKDSMYLARNTDEKNKPWREAAPQSIDCLSEESRKHFKEILEFLESLEVPYTIDGSILGDLSIATETIFEIVSEDDENLVLAKGLRYNRLAKKLQYKKETPAVDVIISAKTLKEQKLVVIKEPELKFYLVQFGPEAKLKSLMVLEKLRKAGVSVFHTLAKDKLTGQMLSADQMNIPYILLLGQKEALENNVVVRSTLNRSQTSVSIENLGDYIKNTIK